MIYRFKIEIDIQADPIEPWDAETVAHDYLRHILEESPLKDHVLGWHTKEASLYPPVPTSANQPQRTWHTQQLYLSPQGATLKQDPPGDKP